MPKTRTKTVLLLAGLGAAAIALFAGWNWARIYFSPCGCRAADNAPNEPLSSLSKEQIETMLRDAASVAAIELPLPPDEFRAELELLLEVLAARLTFSVELARNDRGSFSRSDPEWRWRHRALREPLLTVLYEDERCRYYAAGALLRYGDAGLRDHVERFRDFEHLESFSACVSRLSTVGELLDDSQFYFEDAQFVEEPALLPPPTSPGRVPSPSGMSIDVALDSLQSESLSVRLQSWAWLARIGIVAPTDVVKEAWGRLGEEQRKYLGSFRSAQCLGAHRLRELYEDLVSGRTLSGDVDAALLSSLGRLKSHLARRLAKEIIVERLPSAVSSTELPPVLLSALRTLSSTARDGDIPCLLALTRSESQHVRSFGWVGLVKIQSREAIARLRPALLERDWDEVLAAIVALYDLEVRHERRWDFLKLLAEALTKRPSHDAFWLVGAFERISEFDTGIAEKSFYENPDERTVRDAVEKCLAWYEANRPRA